MASDFTTLRKLAPKLPVPKSLFQGVNSPDFEIPKSLIVFLRSNAAEMVEDFHVHYHNRFVLIVNLKGSGTIVIDNRALEFSSREAVLVFPYQFHHYQKIRTPSVKWMFITFELFSFSMVEPLRNRVVKISENCFTYLRHLVELYAEHKIPEKKRNRMFLLTSLILSDLQTSITVQQSSHSPVEISLMDQVNAYIWDHVDEDIKLPALASRFMLSESHLRYRFRNKMGMSIGLYIKKLRINRARSLLINTNLSVSEISYRCGYQSLYTFSRAFKKTTGYSPKDYKKRMTG